MMKGPHLRICPTCSCRGSSWLGRLARSDRFMFWSGAIPFGGMLAFIVYMTHNVEQHMNEIIERAHGDPPHAVSTAGVLLIIINAAWLASNFIFRRMNKDIDALNRKRHEEMDERVMRGKFMDLPANTLHVITIVLMDDGAVEGDLNGKVAIMPNCQSEGEATTFDGQAHNVLAQALERILVDDLRAAAARKSGP